MSERNINYSLSALALSSLDEQNLHSFNVLLEEFQLLMNLKGISRREVQLEQANPMSSRHIPSFETTALKRSAVKVQQLIEQWLSMTNGILNQRIVDFQEDFHSCFEFIRNLPKRIDTFWQKQLKPWFLYVKNLFTHKSDIVLCAKHFELDQAEILKQFEERVLSPEDIQQMKTQKHIVLDIGQEAEDSAFVVEQIEVNYVLISHPPRKVVPLAKNPSIRQALGITDEFEQNVDDEMEKEVAKHAATGNPMLNYEYVKKMQDSIPPEKSGDPTKSLRILAEQQIKRQFDRWAGGLDKNI